MAEFIIIVLSGMVLVTMLFYGGKLMAAIDNVNQALTDLNNTIANAGPQNNEAELQQIADNINASNAELKKKLGQ